MPSAAATTTLDTSSNDFLQILRTAGGLPNNQTSLLAAAQQFAAAASVAQHFAAAAATSNAGPQQSHLEQSKTTSPVKKKRKLESSTPKSPVKTPTSSSKPKPPTMVYNPTNWEFWGQFLATNQDPAALIRSVAYNHGASTDAQPIEEDSKPAAQTLLENEESGQPCQGSMPKEAEGIDRKRPAAIQELLQMKKARLGQPVVAEKLVKTEEEGTGNSHLSEILSRLCNGGPEEDAETTSNCSLNSLEGGKETPKKKVDEEKRLAQLQTTPLSGVKSLPSRTNDNDVSESPLASLVPHDRVFAQVPGRLSLLSNVVKYKMSVGEVKRRLMGPESFNFSLLGALLRRAKMPEKSQMLVDELNQVGLSIPRGRRRLSQVTLLSALTESESVQFAKDFQRIADTEFPCQQLAAVALGQSSGTTASMVFNGAIKQEDNEEGAGRLKQLEATLELANEFVELLKLDRSPVMDTNADPIFEREVQDPLSTFSMLTHGFGTPAVLVGMQMFSSFVQHQIQMVKSNHSKNNGF
uniref:Transcription factor AP-2 C-terminal domain-containing protein n=1 Tax=Ditylenchus dipsaci TaxID=166011 RepID=A0A915DYY2_9BILA